MKEVLVGALERGQGEEEEEKRRMVESGYWRLIKRMGKAMAVVPEKASGLVGGLREKWAMRSFSLDFLLLRYVEIGY